MNPAPEDPRLARRTAEIGASQDAQDEYGTDLERIARSPYFSRLGAVTQVVSQSESGQVVHNRMTHSIKVASAARSIADAINDDPRNRPLLAELGGCDPLVAQAAGWAHDIGHPPFGHRGERVLDRIAKDELDLPEGFEGNAQTFRALVELDVSDTAASGLNLTAAVRAAVLKYPWARRVVRPLAGDDAELPAGARENVPGEGPAKMSAYSLNLPEMVAVRTAYPRLGPWRQTLECSVMDLADDITYALHDLDDFYRAGVLAYPTVRAEFDGWLRHSSELRSGPEDRHRPGTSLEALRRKIHLRDPWVADDDAFAEAVRNVLDDLIEGVLATPFDGSLSTQRTLSSFVASWTTHLRGSVVLSRNPPVRTGHIHLDVLAWHEIAVLKLVHSRFVLERPELGLYQWGQLSVLQTLVSTFRSWLSDADESNQLPPRLLDFIDLARLGYRRTVESDPALLEGRTSDRQIEDAARARGILDYVASLTDAQAQAMATTASGHPGINWGLV